MDSYKSNFFVRLSISLTQSVRLFYFKKIEKVLDKLEVICYNKGTTNENTQRSKKSWLNFTKNLPEWKTQSTAS